MTLAAMSMNAMSKNQLKRLAAYKMQKNCEAEGLFVVEGVRLCGEALASGLRVVAVCAVGEWYESHGAMPSGAELYVAEREQLERLSNMKSPNQVWMLVERPDNVVIAPEDVGFTDMAGQRLILALDGLQDPGNMGTILRTADWFGIRQVVCSRDTVSCFNPKVVQSTMGAIFRTRLLYCDLSAFLRDAVGAGYATYAAMLDGEDALRVSPQVPAVLVVGNEGNGISDAVAAAVQHRLTIPNIGGTCESLNVGVATGVLCSRFF